MIQSKQVGKTLYLCIGGELDEHSAVFYRKKIDDAIPDSGINKIIIDMSKLRFMDSTGIGVLLGRYKRVAGRGVTICLANPSNSIDKILTISGLYDIMPRLVTKE